MRSGVGNARIANAPEYTQTIIRGWCTEQEVMRCKIPPWSAGSNVKENGCSSKRVRPEARRHVSMKQEHANAIVQSAKDAFGSTVLLGSIRACETKNCAVMR